MDANASIDLLILDKNDKVVTMLNKFDSFEQALERARKHIREYRDQILENFYIAYTAQLSNLEDVSLDEICLIEQEPHMREGCVTRRYWFEIKPKFKDIEIERDNKND